MRRLRVAEWAALAGAVGLVVTLTFDWFSGPGEESRSGFDALPWPVLALVLLSVVLVLALGVAFVSGAVDVFNLLPGVSLAVLAPLTLLVLTVDTLFKPGGATGIEACAWAGLGCMALLVVGVLGSLRDERRTGYGRIAEPPPARPAPPA